MKQYKNTFAVEGTSEELLEFENVLLSLEYEQLKEIKSVGNLMRRIHVQRGKYWYSQWPVIKGVSKIMLYNLSKGFKEAIIAATEMTDTNTAATESTNYCARAVDLVNQPASTLTTTSSESYNRKPAQVIDMNKSSVEQTYLKGEGVNDVFQVLTLKNNTGATVTLRYNNLYVNLLQDGPGAYSLETLLSNKQWFPFLVKDIHTGELYNVANALDNSVKKDESKRKAEIIAHDRNNNPLYEGEDLWFVHHTILRPIFHEGSKNVRDCFPQDYINRLINDNIGSYFSSLKEAEDFINERKNTPPPSPTPLFVTQDRVEIFENDSFYQLNLKSGHIKHTEFASQVSGKHPKRVYFKHKENALAYQYENYEVFKKKYSLMDVMECGLSMLGDNMILDLPKLKTL